MVGELASLATVPAACPGVILKEESVIGRMFPAGVCKNEDFGEDLGILLGSESCKRGG